MGQNELRTELCLRATSIPVKLLPMIPERCVIFDISVDGSVHAIWLEYAASARGGSLCLNSPGQFYKWLPPLVMLQPGLAAAH